jgi:putative ABC transport system ATP-binding protein
MSKKVVVNVNKINKVFQVGTQDVHVLHDITFDVFEGDFVIIFGPSGCGKSTLLHTILGLETPTTGDLTMLSSNIYDNTAEDDRSSFRKHYVGMVYQQANWIKALNVRENVAFPLILLGVKKEDAYKEALRLLDSVGMADWASYMPMELSSGQQQRVSLARALVNDPQIIIADEPTGNLDFKSGQAIMEMFGGLGKQNKTVIMVTHDLEYIKYSTRVVEMFDGHVKAVYDASNMDEVLSKVSSKRGVNIQEDAGVGEKIPDESSEDTVVPDATAGDAGSSVPDKTGEAPNTHKKVEKTPSTDDEVVESKVAKKVTVEK